MASLTDKIIEQHKLSLKSVSVDRTIPTTIDCHLMTIYDDNIIDTKPTISRARDAAQLLINKIFSDCNHEIDDGLAYACLPAIQQHIHIPREKPVPKPKEPTKWEKFAAAKGIRKGKKSRLVYDEETKTYIPRWGYKSKRNQKDREWAIEVPKNEAPDTDMFEKRKNKKSEAVAKNEFQRLRNLSRNSKKVDSTKLGVNPTAQGDRTNLNKTFHLAKKATASMGKFDKQVQGEENYKEKGKKRKFYDNSCKSTSSERDRMLSIAKDISSGDAVLNAKKAAGRFMAGEQGEAGSGKKKQKMYEPKKRNFNPNLTKKGKIGMKAKAKKAQRAGRNAKK